ncbi:unnamed protein product [Amoebophrya sp. A25]|nr:unnamed protein product [Amoebophrya sp. A25]|eukprot:GSA25T00007851001.1
MGKKRPGRNASVASLEDGAAQAQRQASNKKRKVSSSKENKAKDSQEGTLTETKKAQSGAAATTPVITTTVGNKKVVAPPSGQQHVATKKTEKKLQARQPSCPKEVKTDKDPSAIYLANPLSAPIVAKAKEFFAGKLAKKRGDFKVNSGSLRGWRTVSKLHVRSTADIRRSPTTSGNAKNEDDEQGQTSSTAQPRGVLSVFTVDNSAFCNEDYVAGEKKNKKKKTKKASSSGVSRWCLRQANLRDRPDSIASIVVKRLISDKKDNCSSNSTSFALNELAGGSPTTASSSPDDGDVVATKNKRGPKLKHVDCQIGMLEPGTGNDMRVIPAKGSAAHHPVIDRAIDLITRCIRQAGVPDFHTQMCEGNVHFLNDEGEIEEDEVDDNKATKNGAEDGVIEEKKDEDTSMTGTTSSMKTMKTCKNSNKSAGPGGASVTKMPHDPLFRATQSDALRYVFFGVERSTNRAQICLVWNHDDFENSPNLGALVHCLLRSQVSNKTPWLQSVWVHSNKLSHHNNCFFEESGRWLCVVGANEGVREKVFPAAAYQLQISSPPCALTSTTEKSEKTVTTTKITVTPASIFLPPNVFRQANMSEFAKIVQRVRECVRPGDRVLELYGGVGTIGLQLLVSQIAELECSDANPFNAGCFERSVREFFRQFSGSTPGSVTPIKEENVRYVPKAAREMVDRIDKFNVLIVDPPRKGLDAVVVQALTSSSSCSKRSDSEPSEKASKKMSKTFHLPSRLVYISCGFPAFTRDCDALLASGQWVLDRAEGFLLFPGADHLETFALFRRPDAAAVASTN